MARSSVPLLDSMWNFGLGDKSAADADVLKECFRNSVGSRSFVDALAATGAVELMLKTGFSVDVDLLAINAADFGFKDIACVDLLCDIPGTPATSFMGFNREAKSKLLELLDSASPLPLDVSLGFILGKYNKFENDKLSNVSELRTTEIRNDRRYAQKFPNVADCCRAKQSTV